MQIIHKDFISIVNKTISNIENVFEAEIKISK
jgi:hypothetical protein